MNFLTEHSNIKYSAFFCILILPLFALPVTGFCDFLVVQGDKVSLHSSPDSKSKILWEYGSNFPLSVQKREGDWVLVRDFERDAGWIHTSHLQKGHYVIVKANKGGNKTINIRTGPDVDSTVVGNAYYGVVLAVLDKKGQWLQVRHESGLKGWVKLEFVWGM